MVGPLREIVSREHYSHSSAPYGTGSVALELDCGHTERRKQSQEPIYQARCLLCAYPSETPTENDNATDHPKH